MVFVVRVLFVGAWLLAGCHAVAESAAAEKAVAESAATNVWQFSKTADPMESGSIVIASVTGDGVQALVRCWTKTADLDVSFLLSPGLGRADSNSVTLGFDQRRDSTRVWRVSPSGLALFVPRAQRDQLLQRMQEAGSMRLKVSTTTGSQRLLGVPLRGSSRAIRSVLKICN